MEQNLQKLNANQRAEVWGRRITACRNSGITVREWCSREGLSEKTYYYWQRKLYQMVLEESTFVEIPITPVPTTTNRVIATVQISGVCASIHSGADEQTLATLLRAMKSC